MHTTTTVPQSTQQAILSRMAKALAEAHKYEFIAIRFRRDLYRVVGGQREYEVCGGACTCPDYLNRRSKCKHLLLLASGVAQTRPETDEEFSHRAQRESQGAEWVRKQLATWEQYEAVGRVGQADRVARCRARMAEDFPAD